MKSLSLLVRKLWPRLKFFKSRLNFKVKVTRSKTLVPMERSCQKVYTCEIPIIVHKLMARLKFLCTRTRTPMLTPGV